MSAQSPTNDAAMGKFVSRGDDFLQWYDPSGKFLGGFDSLGFPLGNAAMAADPAGATTQVQVNIQGQLYADGGFTYNPSTLVVKLNNVVPATLSANEDSPALSFAGNYWTGSASAADQWSFQSTHGSGSNPGNTFRILYSGSTVASGLVIQNGNAATSGANFPAPILGVQGSIWDGSNPQTDEWQFLTIVGAGTNPTSKLRFQHNGPTTGILTVSVGPGTVATNSVNNSSPFLELQGTYWTGSASASDLWTWQSVLGAGSNPASTLTLAHSGSSGTPMITFPAVAINLGNVQITANGSLRAAAALDLGWTGRAQMQSPADGQITMTNNAQNAGAQLTTGNIIFQTVAPTVAAGQVAFGSTVATTATAGGVQAAPLTVLGYLIANVAGTEVKIPYYAA